MAENGPEGRGGTGAIALLVALAFPAAVRLRLLTLPLERDEGEYAYAGQLMLQGIPPYELVYNMKFPGIYAAYAALMGIFGETIPGIRLALLTVTTITALLLYVLGSRLFDRTAGVVAAAMFAILSLAPPALGLYAHATHFISPFVVAAMILLVRDFSRAGLFGAGALLATGVLMKQPAIFFFAFAVIYVFVVSRQRVRNVAMLAAGGATVAAITAAALAAAGVFDRFWFWTIQYAREYVTAIPLSAALPYLGHVLRGIIGFAPAIWILAAAGLLFLIQRGSRRDQLFVGGLLIASVLATTPGFYFRKHYFIVMFPAVALLAAAAVRFAPPRWPRMAGVAAAGMALVLTMAMNWPRLVQDSEETITRELYGANPFVESIEVARYIREHTQPGERVVVLGSEPQIYFYSGRRSATGYIYAYPLMESHPFAAAMQQEMIREIEAAQPRYVIYVNSRASWLPRPKSHLAIFQWFGQELQKERWTMEGIVVIAPQGTESVWGERARRYRPRTRNGLLVYRRAG